MPRPTDAGRSPNGAPRVRDADRTRAAILDAALVEFGEHGYAGARTGAIARRAGVNAQLISYYFDGKEGLYKALTQRWREAGGGAPRPELPLAEVVASYVRANLTSRSMTRLLIWEGLTGSGMDDADLPFFAEMVADVRRRQERREIAADLDPTAVLLALFGAALAPTVLPHVVERVTGRAADSPEFLDDYATRLAQIVERLAPRR
jgi:TetR/AcrR family transcriptional regulator